MNVTLVDTHVHLQHRRYAHDLSDVLDRASGAGIAAAIIPGTTQEDSAAAVRLTADASAACTLFATVGIHPTEAHDLTLSAIRQLTELAADPHVVGIGEIGLDYYWPTIPDRGWVCADPETQRIALERQLAMASELGLPVVIHDRDAHRDTLEMLRSWKARDPGARGTLHAYAGGVELLDEAIALGFYIGIDGPVTFRNAMELHEVARRVPLSRLLLETDSPYLTPAPHRGKRNEPAFLTHVAATVAQLRGLTVDEVAAATTSNAKELFGLP
jgi:TatD DNase family protein